MFNYRILQWGLVSLFGLVFGLFLMFGFFAGRTDSRSRLTVNNAKEIVKGLNYFKADQARYPSPDEFKDRNIMLEYFSVYPLPSIVTKACPERYAYSTSRVDSFKLEYCLDSNFNGSLTGVNSFDELTRF